MADIPNQPIFRRVEHVVQRHRQLDDTETRAEVTTRLGNGVNEFVTQLVCNLTQASPVQRPQIRRKANSIEQRSP